MKGKVRIPYWAAGAAAGAVAGLFGAGGGLILVPLLTLGTDLEESEVFPASPAIILPICMTSLLIRCFLIPVPWKEALPYLPGSTIGGCFAGAFGHRIPVKWLHRALGLLIIWGGIRYLW